MHGTAGQQKWLVATTSAEHGKERSGIYTVLEN